MKGDFAPLGLSLALELEWFAGLRLCNHWGLRAFAGAQVYESIGVVDHTTNLRLNKGYEREGESEEEKARGPHQRRVGIESNN